MTAWQEKCITRVDTHAPWIQAHAGAIFQLEGSCGLLGCVQADLEEDDSLRVTGAPGRRALVLDDTQPADEQPDDAEDAAKPGNGRTASAAPQLDQAKQPGLADMGAGVGPPEREQHADVTAGGQPNTMQQLGLDSPGVPDQAAMSSDVRGLHQAAAGEEPEEAPHAHGPGSGALRPSTQEPDQAAPAWTPVTSPDGWRSKRKARSTEPSPAPMSKGTAHTLTLTNIGRPAQGHAAYLQYATRPDATLMPPPCLACNKSQVSFRRCGSNEQQS